MAAGGGVLSRGSLILKPVRQKTTTLLCIFNQVGTFAALSYNLLSISRQSSNSMEIAQVGTYCSNNGGHVRGTCTCTHAHSPRRYDFICTLASLSKSEIWLDLTSSCTTRRAPAAAYAYVCAPYFTNSGGTQKSVKVHMYNTADWAGTLPNAK